MRNNMFSKLENEMQSIATAVEKHLENLLPKDFSLLEGELFQAMRYSALSGGKRLRPFLTIATCNMLGVEEKSSLQVASAIELIHTYSLIHDDLPALDNDDYRRGQASCHKKFNEGIAILAGDALLTYAFEILAQDDTSPDPKVRLELIKDLAVAIGYAGMVGGQAIDITTENKQIEYNEIVRLQRMKTGALFSISCEAAAILAHAPRHIRSSLRAYAYNLGLAFQIVDDLLDVQQDTMNIEHLHNYKKRSELTHNKATLISSIGIAQARNHAEMLVQQAMDHLLPFGQSSTLLKELALYVLHRQG